MSHSPASTASCAVVVSPCAPAPGGPCRIRFTRHGTARPVRSSPPRPHLFSAAPGANLSLCACLTLSPVSPVSRTSAPHISLRVPLCALCPVSRECYQEAQCAPLCLPLHLLSVPVPAPVVLTNRRARHRALSAAATLLHHLCVASCRRCPSSSSFRFACSPVSFVVHVHVPAGRTYSDRCACRRSRRCDVSAPISPPPPAPPAPLRSLSLPSVSCLVSSLSPLLSLSALVSVRAAVGRPRRRPRRPSSSASQWLV